MWSKELVKKIKMVHIIEPLVGIDHFSDPEHKDYDLLAVITRVLDVVTGRMGLSSGITREEVIEHIAPDLQRYDETRYETRSYTFHEDLVGRVIDKMVNKGERTSFKREYVDYSSDPPVKRLKKFKLLTEHQSAEGAIVLRATSESINIFLQVLEIDIEDRREATLRLMEIQIQKGKVQSAMETAKEHERLTGFYMTDIHARIEQTKRDLREVDWSDKMPENLNKALQHIEECILLESSISRNLKQDKLVLQGNSEALEKIADIVQLESIIRNTTNMHLQLQEVLLSAREIFRAEQLRQVFKPRFAKNAIDLERGVLHHALLHPRHVHDGLMDLVYPYIAGVTPPKIVSLNALINWLLKPVRVVRKFKRDEQQATLVDHAVAMQPFMTPGLEVTATRFIMDMLDEGGGATTLGTLLQEADRVGMPLPAQLAVKYMVLGRFVSRSFKDAVLPAGIAVLARDTGFATSHFKGMEFLLERQAGGGARA